ncbi:MAG TPA: EAL domain-containing protein [Methylophilaceae bacterium]|nr:EAL domain-containing protein [Methylophilaceae bacterium]
MNPEFRLRMINRFGLPDNSLSCYLISVGIFVLAFVIRLMVLPDYGLPFITFYPAVVIAALLCGTSAGLAVIVMSAIGAYYISTSTFFSLSALSVQAPALTVFVVAAVLICVIIDQIVSSLIKASRANDQLQQDISKQKAVEAAIREREQHFRTLFELFGVGVALCDAQSGKYIRVNRKFREMVGYSARELRSLTSRDITHPDDYAMQQQCTEALLSGELSEYTLQKRYIRKDGSVIWVDLTCNALWSPPETPTYHLAAVHDITDKKRADEALHAAMERLAESEAENRLILDSAGEGIYGLDANGNVMFANPAATKMLGYDMDELLGHPIHAWIHHSYADGTPYPREDCPVIKSMARGEAMTITDEVFWRKDGSSFPVEYTSTPIYKRNKPAGVVVSFNDISLRKQSEAQMLRLAHYDSITGLPNRVLFMDRLKYEIRKSHRAKLPLALMFIDLDNFKEINDTLGHDKGDLLLKDAAQRLSRCVRDSDTVARMGGDEFTIIMSELDDAESVERVVQSIRDAFAVAFQLGDQQSYVTSSIGITLFPQDATEIEELLKNADQAMYAAKREGRDCYRYFTQSMQESAQTRMRLINDMRNALAKEQFRVYYQPIVDLASGNVTRAEALIRWQHPQRGAISPTEFIPLAEDTGLIIDIGNWVFREVTTQVMQWREQHDASFQISVNKSPAQFHNDHESHSAWPAYLRDHNIPGESIIVEITEGALLNASTSITEQLLKFRDAGMEVSLDDFGIGYSSLSYLQKFDLDNLKIDQAFVRNLAPDSDDMALCKAIIVMAHTLGMKVIAEGVETAEQRDLLAAAGCDYGQGFLFSRAVSAGDFAEFFH